MASKTRPVACFVISLKADEEQETRVGLLLSDLEFEPKELMSLGREIHAGKASLSLNRVLAGSVHNSREDFAVHGVVREVASPVDVDIDSVTVLEVF